ncbi:PREDICTED: LOW QUALITY PROTEIN: pentatricopeptide repeat-containing protein At4g19191, mitochondrial-like [Camelina sativa]|uniref:LOW QUALITY PROTEIN: pentatricopeptide repeat-containing protein At4g19191, mitochondrial-like n=1 Tax=Camelina sativa TaxID=90675 RepID=A0ABM0UDW3_CAMSA|nr:PREDICTED: LOW QUALITY PROTEIN: pentatricopeptide repeat-containing protein At4g19191, mitochondrial-like [Camelina sativa]
MFKNRKQNGAFLSFAFPPEAFGQQVRESMSLIQRRLNRFHGLSSVNAWNFQIREAVNRNDPVESLLIFREMKRGGFEPNNFTFPFVAKACARLSDTAYCEMLNAHVLKSPFWSDVFVGTATVDMFVKCNSLDYAAKVFERMPERDVTTWNAMLSGFCHSGHTNKAFSLFREMRLYQIPPDSVTVMALIHSASFEKSLKLLKAMHALGIHLGVDVQVTVANTWISSYAKCGDLDSAKSVFEAIDRGDRTVVSWNSMFKAYSVFSEVFAASGLYRLMLREKFKPDLSTFINLAASGQNPDTLTQGRLIHSHAIHLGTDQDMEAINTFISMYSKSGDTCSARLLFDIMPFRTCVSWTVMISAYAEKGDMDEALALFHVMAKTGEKPDLVTLLSLISGCGKFGSLEIGKWIDARADMYGCKKDNVMVCNALIDMYSKCGSIPEARDIFDNMSEKTVVTWTTMIAGYALNGIFGKALELFDKMIDLDRKPNHITFLAVLQACAHSGSLEKGWECFLIMKQVHNISPGLEHYSCMVDLLGKKGKLEEALELIRNMSVKPDAGIWGTLLSACKIHRNVKIAEQAADSLFNLEPQMAAPYVEMANIYAAAGMWDGFARIRSMMKHRNIKKYPGESVIQVNGKNHTFTVGEHGHVENEAIYLMLNGLSLFARDEHRVHKDVYTEQSYELCI